MKFASDIKNTWISLPAEIQRFLKSALILFIIWKLLYHLFLFNGRVLDKPLTDLSCKAAYRTVTWCYPQKNWTILFLSEHDPENPSVITFADYICISGRKVLGVADPCNALELYILFAGFIIAFPSSLIRKFIFCMIGFTVIFIANVLRLAGLTMMGMNRIQGTEIAHHYLFKLIVYCIIFALWIWFTNQKKHEKVS